MKVFELLSIGTSGIADEETVNRIRLVNTLSLFVGIAIAIIGPVICYCLKWQPAVVVPLSIEFLVNCSVLIFSYFRRSVAAALILYFLQCASIIYFSIVLGRLLQLEFTIILLIAIAFLIFKKNLLRRIAIVMALVDLIILEIGYYNNPSQSAMPISYNQAFLIHVCVVAGLIILTILVSRPYVKSNDIKNELQRANHLIKIFVAQVTHELRTPLDSMHQVMQLLRKEIQVSRKAVQEKANLNNIQSLVDIGYTVSSNARNIVNNVLDMAEIEAGKMPQTANEAFKVRPFFAKILEVHRILARNENVRLDLVVDPEIPEVIYGNPLNIHQILTNLLANALKYGSKDSTVTITVKRRPEIWELKVSNSGPGIPPEKLDFIFDPFVTGRTGQVQGSGLGLYIVKTKVGAMNGTIRVESRPEGKTSFTVSLPFREGKLKDLPDEAAPRPISEAGEAADAYMPNLHKVHVMVAEDNKLTSFLLSRFLEGLGCSFTIVKNGRELLEEARKKCPGECPDIIILDGHMPLLNGEETIRALKQTPELTHIPIIIATGDLYSGTVDRMLAAGAVSFIKKPIDHSALQKAIGLCLNKMPQD